MGVPSLTFPPCEQVQLSSATNDGCGSGTVAQATGTGQTIEDNGTKKLNAYDFRQEAGGSFLGIRYEWLNIHENVRAHLDSRRPYRFDMAGHGSNTTQTKKLRDWRRRSRKNSCVKMR